jgi:hypothetical protein
MTVPGRSLPRRQEVGCHRFCAANVDFLSWGNNINTIAHERQLSRECTKSVHHVTISSSHRKWPALPERPALFTSTSTLSNLALTVSNAALIDDSSVISSTRGNTSTFGFAFLMLASVSFKVSIFRAVM